MVDGGPALLSPTTASLKVPPAPIFHWTGGHMSTITYGALISHMHLHLAKYLIVLKSIFVAKELFIKKGA